MIGPALRLLAALGLIAVAGGFLLLAPPYLATAGLLALGAPIPAVGGFLALLALWIGLLALVWIIEAARKDQTPSN